MKYLPLILTGALVVASVAELSAAPIISEFMASNSEGLTDEDGDTSDWIEIHNPDGSAVSLEGYFLTDDASDLSGWEFPAVSLEAGGYLVVFASGKNRSESTGELHANFKLSADGGYLALVAADGMSVLSEFSPVYPAQFEDQAYGIGTFGSVTQESLFSAGGQLSYLVPSDGSLGATWTESPAEFDDSSWAAATSGVGWETSGGPLEPAVATDLRSEMQGINGSGYFRIPFTYSSTGKQLQSLILTMRADDGFVAYINGQRVASNNAPAEPSWNSTATGSQSDNVTMSTPSIHVIAATPGLVVDGENVLAIQGMNSSSGGSDFLLDPVLTAEVMDSTGTQRAGYFDSATPGLPNAGGQAAGPVFIDVTDKPDRPVAGTDLVVTAEIGEVASPVAELTMFYRVMFDAEANVAMADDGVAPDAVAGDGIFTALVPGNLFEGGDMVRWRFLARDELGLESKHPPFREPLDSHEYVGSVAVNPGVESLLPVVEIFVQNTSAFNNAADTRGAVFYLGELYDNIFFNRHGQSTGGFPKKSYNLDFNKTQRFRWHPDEKRVKDIDLLTNWADKSKARHVLSWEIMREAGVHAHFAFTVRVEQNGEFFSVADFVEDADDIYLERAGLNPDGALYKMYNNRLMVGDGVTSPAVEKKNRREEGGQDLAEFIADLNQSGTENQWDFIYDNVNLPMMVNMCAANCIVRNTDMHRKNWYIYRDSGRTDEWATLPWDLDLAHGRKWNGTDNYFDNENFYDGVTQVGTAVSLISKMWARPDVRDMLNRRIRTLSDRFLNYEDTPYDQRYFERRLDEILATVDPPGIVPSDAQLDLEKWGSWAHSGSGRIVNYDKDLFEVVGNDYETMREAVVRWKGDADGNDPNYPAKSGYLPGRRATINGLASIPDSQSGQIPYSIAHLVSAGDAVATLVPTDASDDADWMMPAFNDAAWATGVTGVGFDSSKYLPLIGVDTKAEMHGQNATVYMRMEFDVTDPTVYGLLQLHMKFDDGFVAYLNGVKLLEQNAPADLAWNSAATTSGQEALVDEYDVFDVSSGLGELVAGTNVLAIHGMNGSAGSSDFLIMPELLAGVPDSNGSIEPLIEFGALEFNPESGNQDEEYIELVNNNSIAVDVSDWTITGGVEFTLAGGTVIPANSSLFISPDVTTFRSRATSPTGGEQRFVVGPYRGHLSSFGESLELIDPHGALNSSTSYVGDPSDAQKYLVISEIMYHPEPDGAAEYIELLNISDAEMLDLNGVNFTRGISFDFSGSAVTNLPPGGRVLVVQNIAAFEAAHSAGLPVAGVFALDSSLSNGGEAIKLEDAEGGTIQEFTYDDKAPWPTSPDTLGFSLVLIQPGLNPDPSDPSNWRASSAVGGTPGEAEDTLMFSGDPAADGDGDGLNALVEYFLGTSDADGSAGAAATSTGAVESQGAMYPTFSYRSNPSVGDIDASVETSLDLANWTDAGGDLVEIDSSANGDGTVTRVLRFASPITQESVRYFRLRVELRQ
ncbi:MAG: lamin tail domain-containing protein [Verrucomicrobiales bacterium]